MTLAAPRKQHSNRNLVIFMWIVTVLGCIPIASLPGAVFSATCNLVANLIAFRLLVASNIRDRIQGAIRILLQIIIIVLGIGIIYACGGSIEGLYRFVLTTYR